MIIRQIKTEDAKNFALLIQQVEKESEYMLFEADERNISMEEQLEMIESMEEANNSAIFVAEKENKLIGFLFVKGGHARRIKLSAYIVMGILRDYRGQGIGTKLLSELEKWAEDHHIHRLELLVAIHNEAALRLYKKMGFEVEGTKRDSLCINGEYVDEYYMAKIIK